MCHVIIIILFLGWNYNFYYWKKHWTAIQHRERRRERASARDIESGNRKKDRMCLTLTTVWSRLFATHLPMTIHFFILRLHCFAEMFEIETCITHSDMDMDLIFDRLIWQTYEMCVCVCVYARVMAVPHTLHIFHCTHFEK